MDIHVDSANNMSLHTEDSQSDLSDYNEYSEYDNYSYYYGDYYVYDYDYTEDKVAEVINYVSIFHSIFSMPIILIYQQNQPHQISRGIFHHFSIWKMPVLDLMDPIDPIGGPAFSSQTLIGGLQRRTTIWTSVKFSHTFFPNRGQLPLSSRWQQNSFDVDSKWSHVFEICHK